jgi:rubrerythrin
MNKLEEAQLNVEKMRQAYRNSRSDFADALSYLAHIEEISRSHQWKHYEDANLLVCVVCGHTEDTTERCPGPKPKAGGSE